MFVLLIILHQLIFPLDGKLYMVKTNQKGYMVNTGKQTHHKTPKLKPGRIGSLHDVEFGRDYAGVFPPINNNQGSVGSAPACSLATRCKVGKQGDRACGPNSRCDRKQAVCVCNSPAQDYPNCCFPSCRGIDAVCVKGGPCQCITKGKYPDCEEVCLEGCGDGEICKKVGGVAKCVCKKNFIKRGGVCKTCKKDEIEIHHTTKRPDTDTGDTTIRTNTGTGTGTDDGTGTDTDGTGTDSTGPGTGTDSTDTGTGTGTGTGTCTGTITVTGTDTDTVTGTGTCTGIVTVTGIDTDTNTPTGTCTSTDTGTSTDKLTDIESTTEFFRVTKRGANIIDGNTCKKKERGPLELKTVESPDGWIRIQCEGGCIQVHTARYSCCGVESIPNHLMSARILCNDKDKCAIKNFDKHFSDTGCKGQKQLVLGYSCNGGRHIVEQSENSICKEPDNPVISTPRTQILTTTGRVDVPAVTARGHFNTCNFKKPVGGWRMVKRDIDTKNGWIKIHCEGGCIKLHKVRYNCCHNGLDPIPENLDTANKLCAGKETCEIRNMEKTFGDPGCSGSRRLWIWYSCMGGKDRTTQSKKNVCFFS